MSEPRCETCRFWAFGHTVEGDGDCPEFSSGRCRRHAPLPFFDGHPSKNCLTLWPQTCDDDWCGEYQSRHAANEKPGERTSVDFSAVPCSRLYVGARAWKAIISMGILNRDTNTVDVRGITEYKLGLQQNCGPVTQKTIREVLANIGFELK